MNLFTFHLAETTFRSAFKAFWNPPEPGNVPGLIHAECMACMTLGSQIFSPSRFLIREVAVFAQWESEKDINNFLENDNFGKTLSKGWHTRLIYLRQWGTINEFVVPNDVNELDDPEAPVVAVTLARMKIFQVPRFIHWGRPVEKLVRDHPGVSFALAAIRLPRTVSTFSVWKSQKEMVDMVHGRSSVSHPKRHAQAMKERERKDFHFQFTTLRFRPIAEYGSWEGRSNIIPNLNIRSLA
jgi:heme-degrading monooxygenase HmoA